MGYLPNPLCITMLLFVYIFLKLVDFDQTQLGMDACYTLCRKNMDYNFCQKYPKKAAERLYNWARLELDEGRKLRLIQLASLVKDSTPTHRAPTLLHLFSDTATSSQMGRMLNPKILKS